MSKEPYTDAVKRMTNELLQENPYMHPQKAFNKAKKLAKRQQNSASTYRPRANDKKESGGKYVKKQIPEHIKATMEKQKKAEEERGRAGRALPRARFYSGGRASGR